MLAAQPRQLARTGAGDVESNDAVVVAVALPAEESGGLSPIDELGCGVVPEEERVRHLLDRRPLGIGTAAHRQEELVLCRREPLGLRLLLAPIEEPAQLGAEPQEVLVVAIGESPNRRHK